MNIKRIVLGLIFTIWGIFLTIGLYKEAKKEFKKEELKIIFWCLFFMTSISFICAGLNTMFFE